MATRENGFYWVFLKTKPDGIWEVAEWTGTYWLVTGDDVPWEEREIIEIGERVTRGN